MSDATKHTILRVLAHAAALLLLYILQAMVFGRLRIGGAAPLLLPLAVVGAGLFEGPGWGGGFGIAAGFLCDISFSNSTVLFTILLTGVGMGVGILSDFMLARGFPSYALCAVGTLVAAAFFQMFPLWIYAQVPPSVLIKTAGFQSLYSLVFLLPVYYLSRLLGRRARL